MASDPGREQRTYTFSGGWIRGAKGLLDYLFGSVPTEWGTVRTGRRPYGSRQRSNAAAGQVMFLELDNGEVYTVRTSATQTKFLNEIISRAPSKIQQVWSERGTLYGKKPVAVVP
jgi:hypothetical protein